MVRWGVVKRCVVFAAYKFIGPLVTSPDHLKRFGLATCAGRNSEPVRRDFRALYMLMGARQVAGEKK